MDSWHDSDDFWETMASMVFTEESWAAGPAEVEQALHLLGASLGAAILDLCCGVGRHSLEFARRGFNVTGVDRTAAYIQRAQQRAKDEGLSAEFVLEDMRHFCRPDAFDAAIIMFASFRYFEDASENRQVLVNVHRSLKDGGVLMVDVMGKEVLARVFQERDWREENGRFLLQERRVQKNWSWMENRWIMLQGQERHEFTVSHWLYSAAELTDTLRECGFGAVDVYGDLDGVPYDHTARRLVIVAKKPIRQTV